ncbi:MAG: PEP-CTERM sorting domain-containing protein [Bradyrhizobium sp.]|jgi:PEP-CTERM motif
MSFKSAALVAASLALLSTTGTQASTYNLTLNNTLYGPEGGTGTLTVNGTPGTGTFTEGSGLTGLSFSVDGSNNFTLANDLGNASVTFLNGNLINIAYVGFANGIQLSLDTGLTGYVFTDLANISLSSAGSISASPVAATPLPSTWGMMLLGLGVVGFLGYRRKSKPALPFAQPEFA